MSVAHAAAALRLTLLQQVAHAAATALPFGVLVVAFAIMVRQHHRDSVRRVDAQIQADDRSATQDSLPNLGAASLLNDEPPAAQPPPPAVDLQAGHVAARWMSLRMLLEERLDPLVAARGFYTQECMVTAPQQAADAICAQFVESLRPVRRALGAWLRPETAAPGAHPLAAVAAGEEVVARAREVVREVLEHRVGVWRYRRLEEFNLRERLEYEAIALGDALATAAGKAVLDLQGADRFVEVDAPEPW